jgi:hypothetical protein
VKKEQSIQILRRLGDLFAALGQEQPWSGYGTGLTEEEYSGLQQLIGKVNIYNPWFTKPSVLTALRSLGEMLKADSLLPFAEKYGETSLPKRVAIIMAGNLPLVGFHDLMCVLLSGHTAVCKLSSNDAHLLPAFTDVLKKWDPEVAGRIEWTVGPVKHIEAVIATGSDNSANYFEQYFGKYPHIFRRNRTSVAVLSGDETEEELQGLGADMFRYFGLGCRNVSKLFVPQDFDLNRVFEAIVGEGEIIHHHKYANNYDYNRTIYLMNSVPFLDNNFCMLKEDDGLFSPLSVFYVDRYASLSEVELFLLEHKDSIQTVVGSGYQPIGKAQEPAIDDYADGIDTMEWLVRL